MLSQGQALTHPTQKSTLKFNHFSDFENGYFNQNITRKLHFEHKTTEGLPQYLRPIVLEQHRSSLISLRLICRACKSTSQRKLESWHAGSSLHVPLIYIFFDQFAIDMPCLQKHLSAQT